MAKKAPAFQFYPADFIEGTSVFTVKETGAYIRLLCFQWTKDGLPSEIKTLERLAGIKNIENVLKKFTLKDEIEVNENGEEKPVKKYRNMKLEEVRKKQREYSEKQSKKAKEQHAKGKIPDYAKPDPDLKPIETNFNTSFVNPEFSQSMNLWIQHMRNCNKMKTQLEVEMAYKELIRLSSNNESVANSIVQYSISSGYKSLIVPSEKDIKKLNQQTPATSTRDYGAKK